MNHTLLSKVRCIMLSSDVPKYFYGEAVMIACCLNNMTPSVALTSL